MRARTLLITTCLLLGTAPAALAVDFKMRPGRWEFTTQLDYGTQQLPPGMPLAEPTTEIGCYTAAEVEEDVKKLLNPAGLLDPSCKISNYRAAGQEISYKVICDDATFDYLFTMHSPDAFSGVADTHGEDASQKLKFMVTGKRTADACSAQELAQDAKDTQELEENTD